MFQEIWSLNSEIPTLSGTSELVVTGSKRYEGQIFSAGSDFSHSLHRCFHSGLGREFRLPDYSGNMVQENGKVEYKLSGIASSYFYHTKLSPTIEKSISFDTIGQYYGGPIYQQTRGHKILSVVLQGMGTVAIGNKEQYERESSSYCRGGQYFTRPIKQNKDQTNGMDFER